MPNLQRRIEKQIFAARGYTDGTGGGFSDLTQIARERYQYDGWNLVVRFAVNIYGSSEDNIPRQIYTWGIDAGSESTNASNIQEAGGVGGLLWLTDIAGTSTITYIPSYDGNCNIIALMNATSNGIGAGQWSAIYEYDAFGKILRASGPAAQINPFRFSTQYADDESSLVYYGYRYLNTQLGRWLSRDPIDEDGGINLTGSMANNIVNWVDVLGLEGVNLLPEVVADDKIAQYLKDFNKTIPRGAIPRVKEDVTTNNDLRNWTDGLIKEPGQFCVAGHGSPTDIEDKDAKEIAGIIKSHKDYKPGMRIVLLACHCGATSYSRTEVSKNFAQKLSLEFPGTEVTAPNSFAKPGNVVMPQTGPGADKGPGGGNGYLPDGTPKSKPGWNKYTDGKPTGFIPSGKSPTGNPKPPTVSKPIPFQKKK